MERRKAKLLYISCDRSAHNELPLNRLCIDSRCKEHVLLCEKCIEADHKGHQVTALNEFVDKLEDIKYSKQQPTSNTPLVSNALKELKQLKVDATSAIDTIRRQIIKELSRLDAVTAFYESIEKTLEQSFSSCGRQCTFVMTRLQSLNTSTENLEGR